MKIPREGEEKSSYYVAMAGEADFLALELVGSIALVLGPSFLAFVRAARLVNSGCRRSREGEPTCLLEEQAGGGKRRPSFFAPLKLGGPRFPRLGASNGISVYARNLL